MNKKDLNMLSEAYENEILKEYSSDYFLRKARSKRLAKEAFFKALNKFSFLI